MLADWRGDALPKEPDKLRPAVVVEDDGLSDPSYPNAILVPLTEAQRWRLRTCRWRLRNGCGKMCWAVSHLVATTAKARLRATGSRIAPDQLAAIRRQIALAIGLSR